MNKEQFKYRARLDNTLENRDILLTSITNFMINESYKDKNLRAVVTYFPNNQEYSYQHLIYSTYYKQGVNHDFQDLKHIYGKPLPFEYFYLNVLADVKQSTYSCNSTELKVINKLFDIKPTMDILLTPEIILKTIIKESKVSNYVKKVKKFVHPLKSRYTAYIKRAKSKKKDFSLTFEEFIEIISKDCTYCNSTPKENTMSIDRIDSNLGYIPGNVQPCCVKCNTMKWDFSEEVFKEHIIKIYNHSFKDI